MYINSIGHAEDGAQGQATSLQKLELQQSLRAMDNDVKPSMSCVVARGAMHVI